MPPEEREESRGNGTFPPSGDVGSWLMEIIIACVAFVFVLLALGYWLEWGLDQYRAFLDMVYRIWDRIRAIVMVIFMMASIFCAGFIIVISRRFFAISVRLPDMVLGGKKLSGGVVAMQPARAKKEITNEWEEVQKLMQSENTSDWNMAILRADTLLDDVLQYLGHEGATVGERLARVDPTAVPSVERIRSAHRLRNAIAHDPSIPHTKETVDYALKAYEVAFREMGVMG